MAEAGGGSLDPLANLIAEREFLDPVNDKRRRCRARQADTRCWRVADVRRRLGATVLAAFVSLAGAGPAPGQANAASEYQVKAAFLFHFAQFVEWPPEAFENAGAPFTYCTMGEDPFHGVLDEGLSGKTIGGRTLRVRHLKEPREEQGCQLLFLGTSEKKRLSAAIATASGSAVLTVGETEHFAQEGGIIGFCREQNKIRFEINLDAAEKAKLKISAKLLALAKTVIGNPRGN
jgi:hypothetical protein